jgi:hypothetical protein
MGRAKLRGEQRVSTTYSAGKKKYSAYMLSMAGPTNLDTTVRSRVKVQLHIIISLRRRWLQISPENEGACIIGNGRFFTSPSSCIESINQIQARRLLDSIERQDGEPLIGKLETHCDGKTPQKKRLWLQGQFFSCKN